MRLISFLFLSLVCVPVWADVAYPPSSEKVYECTRAFIMMPLILCILVILCSVILFCVFNKKNTLNNKKKKILLIFWCVLVIFSCILVIRPPICQGNVECMTEYMKNKYNLKSWCYDKLYELGNLNVVCPDCRIEFGMLSEVEPEKCRICKDKYYQSWEYKVFKNIYESSKGYRYDYGFE